MEAIKARGLTKSYGETQALSGVDLEVRGHEIFGIIGPDGAGKTSLLRILTTLILPDEGQASVLGSDVVLDYKEIRNKIGYMPGRFSLYKDLSVEENLNFFAALFKASVKENYHLIEDIYSQIEPFRKRKAGALSGGMKQKLALCCALIHKPEILFLDEPTTGVDPVSRREFWEILGRLKKEGITVVVTTPYMDEATLCDRIALIKEGVVLSVNTPRSIKSSYKEILWAVTGNNMPKILQMLRKLPYIKSSFAFGDVHHVTVQAGTTATWLRRDLAREGFRNLSVFPIDPSIEDCYMYLAARKK